MAVSPDEDAEVQETETALAAAHVDCAPDLADGDSNKRKAAAADSSETEEEPVPDSPPARTFLRSAAKKASAPAAPSSSKGPDAAAGAKKQKLAPMFERSLARKEAGGGESSNLLAGAIEWRERLGNKKSCLHGTFRDPSPSHKLALFDLDGTLVRPKINSKWPSATDPTDFKFCFPGIVARVQQLYRDGFAIVIVSNQKQTPQSGVNRLETWKKKLAYIARALDVPLRVFAALADDKYRKPRLGIWDDLTARLNGDLAPDMNQSFYVGDAAGRKTISPKDHSDTDYKWALNAGLPFLTPEQFFLNANENLNIPTKPWEARPDNLERLPIFGGSGPAADASDSIYFPSDTPLIPNDDRSEIILFVGSPASGKTAFFRRHLESAGYEWVNQDTLRTRERCVAAVRRCIEDGGRCVVDNTNRDKATRKHYIDLAKATSTPIRAFHFDVAKAVCYHNNHFRAAGAGPNDEPKRDAVPPSAIESFYKSLQLPRIEEGFAEQPKTIRWQFTGDEALRKRYEMYYS